MPSNTRYYDRVGALYDAIIGPVSRNFRERAATALQLSPDGRLLVVGVGSGLDLQFFPPETSGVGVDLSDGMLLRAKRRRAELAMRHFELRKMNAEALDLPDASFDAVYLPLIVTVAADGARVLAEAARVAKPGARLVIVDKLWPEDRDRPALVRSLSQLTGKVATHIDRRFSEIYAGAPHLEVLSNEPALFAGYFRLIVLRKPE
jgi:ubiquinone/menaquinone biosynthesis C-methylase UbiE